MFSRQQTALTEGKIPYAVYETARYGHVRRFRSGAYEITVATALIVIVVLGGIWLHRLSQATAPQSLTYKNQGTTTVDQPPQSNVSTN